MEIKDELLKEKHHVLSGYARLRMLDLIFKQPFPYYKLDSNKRKHLNVLLDSKEIRYYLLNSYWV